MKAVIYARQSSGDENESASVEQQISNCRQLAIEMDLEIIGVCQDLNISGKTYPDTPEAIALAAVDEEYKKWVRSTYDRSQPYRKGLAEAMSKLKAAEFLLLDDFTRLMRPLSHSYLEGHVSQQLKTMGVQIHCVKGGKINLSSFADNLVTTIVSQINANQIEIQRSKSIEALRKRKDEGYRATGSNFRGYRHIGHQTYEIVPEEAKIVKRAYELGLQYLPYQRICRMISKEFGYQALTYGFIHNIYKRPEYAGFQYNSGGELIPSMCFKDIPIITLAEFQQMQARIKNKRVFNRDRKEIYAFTGLCYCGYCGSGMRVMSGDPYPNSKEKQRLHNFICMRNTFGHENKQNCGKARMRYQYYNNRFNLPPETSVKKRWPVTGDDLKSAYTPADLKNLGLFESLMPLVALPLVNHLKQFMSPQKIQEKIQELEASKLEREEHEKNLSNMLFAKQIDNAQFVSMAAQSKTEREKISRQLIELLGQSTTDQAKEENGISTLLYLLSRKKRIDKNLYKRYAQATIEKITMFAYYIVIDFMNGKQLKLERIPNFNARPLPDWSLEIKNNKAYITYFYKSFYTGDKAKATIYDDDSMKIVTVGRNPVGGEYILTHHPGSARAREIREKMADL